VRGDRSDERVKGGRGSGRIGTEGRERDGEQEGEVRQMAEETVRYRKLKRSGQILSLKIVLLSTLKCYKNVNQLIEEKAAVVTLPFSAVAILRV
jgi:hypothetical protein